MFKIFISMKNDINKGEWIDLPIKDLDRTTAKLKMKYGDWTISKCLHSELLIRIEGYQKESSYDNLCSINWLARDYNTLSIEEKEMIKSLSNEGKEFEELVREIVDDKVKNIAQNELDKLENMNEKDAEEYCKNLFNSLFC